MYNKIKNFLSFDGRLNRKSFSLIVLPCLLILGLLSIILMMFLEADPRGQNFITWVLILAFLPLISLFSCLFMSFYFVQSMDRMVEAEGWLFYLTWSLPFILGLLLPIGLLSYLFFLIIIKRLNDLRMNRHWVFLILVPFLNYFFLVFLLLKDSAKAAIKSDAKSTEKI